MGCAIMSYEAALKKRYSAVRARLTRPTNVPKAILEQVPVKLPPRALLPPPFDLLAPLNWRSFVRLAAFRMGMTEDEILGRAMDVPTVYARQLAMTMAHGHMEISYARLGLHFGMDHTTVRNAVLRFASGEAQERYEKYMGHKLRRPALVAPRARPHATLRWTPELVAEAVAMRDDGMLLKDIAKHFGVTPNAIGAKLKRTREAVTAEPVRLAA